MLDLNKTEQNAIVAGLRSGIGLTDTCAGLNLDLFEVTKYLKQHPDFMQLLKSAAADGYKNLLGIANQGISRRSYGRYKSAISGVNNFVTSINLWESHCTKRDFDKSKFMALMQTAKSISEVATATGHTREEMYELIYNDKNLLRYCLQYGYI